MNCRFCDSPLTNTFVELFNSPPSNSFLKKEQLNELEIFYPLKVYVCDSCYLVQLDEFKKHHEIFDENYLYFSSFSQSWLKHCKEYVENITKKLLLNKDNFVVEIASNDGYLLQYFVEKKIPVLGIEPTKNTAKIAIGKGVNTEVDYFGVELATRLANKKKADLLLGNNVLAHVPNINDFVKGLKILLNEKGTITIEFPHLYQLVLQNQFDTIYHEHFSYLSLFNVSKIFKEFGLEIYHVEELTTHGGSLRIYGKHIDDDSKIITKEYQDVLAKELEVGINTLDFYKGFQEKCESVKIQFLDFLIEQKKNNKTVIAYGAAAKGNTLLNYCGVKSDFIDYVVDASTYKQNTFLPGSHIPVYSEEIIRKTKPDFVVILPWNLKDEIGSQLDYIKEWGGKFVIAIPRLKIF